MIIAASRLVRQILGPLSSQPQKWAKPYPLFKTDKGTVLVVVRQHREFIPFQIVVDRQLQCDLLLYGQKTYDWKDYIWPWYLTEAIAPGEYDTRELKLLDSSTNHKVPRGLVSDKVMKDLLAIRAPAEYWAARDRLQTALQVKKTR